MKVTYRSSSITTFAKASEMEPGVLYASKDNPSIVFVRTSANSIVFFSKNRTSAYLHVFDVTSTDEGERYYALPEGTEVTLTQEAFI